MGNWLRNILLPCIMVGTFYVAIQEAQATDGQAVLDTIQNDDVEGLLALIEAGADVNSMLPSGTYPIIAATERANIEMIELLTGNNANVFLRDDDGVNALHIAARIGSVDTIKLLRAFRVPTNIIDADGVTPLYYALMAGKLDAAKYLIDSEDARVNIRDKQGNPMAFRVLKRGDNPKIIEHMIANKLNIFTRNKDDKTLLEVAKKLQYKQSEEVLQQAQDAKFKAYQEKLNQQKAQ